LHFSNTPALRVQRPIPVINRTAPSVRLKLCHASGVEANSNPDEVGVRHPEARLDGDAGPVLHLASIRVTSKVGDAFEPVAAVPAVAADLERAAGVSAEAWAVAGGVCFGVDGFSVVADDRKAVVAAVFA
jgi:hypothetical protein